MDINSSDHSTLCTKYVQYVLADVLCWDSI